MFILGLTGGIGSGKSVASNYFAKLGVKIVDTDVIARQVVQPGTSALHEIKCHFGPTIINTHGSLDRKSLRAKIFANDAEKQWLEQLLHPLIIKATEQELNSSNSKYLILVSPLLIESGRHKLTDRVLVIDSPEVEQLKRAQHRDNSDEAQIKAIMHKQLSRVERLEYADDIVLNNSNIESLHHQLESLHQKYLSLAANQESKQT